MAMHICVTLLVAHNGFYMEILSNKLLIYFPFVNFLPFMYVLSEQSLFPSLSLSLLLSPTIFAAVYVRLES